LRIKGIHPLENAMCSVPVPASRGKETEHARERYLLTALRKTVGLIPASGQPDCRRATGAADLGRGAGGPLKSGGFQPMVMTRCLWSAARCRRTMPAAGAQTSLEYENEMRLRTSPLRFGRAAHAARRAACRSAPDGRDLFWAAVGRGAEEAGRVTGANVLIRAPVQANAPSQQLQLLAALEGERLDALVIGPLTTDEFKPPVARLRAKGVKVVVLERPLPDGLGDVFLGYNQAEMAGTAVRLFAGMVQDGDEAAMLRANSLERVTVRERTLMNDFKKLRPKSVLHAEIMVGARKGDDYEQCLQLLTAHPKIAAVCTPFSACSMAMI
jgi:ABC-type sugar transport system substrate-binding protein